MPEGVMVEADARLDELLADMEKFGMVVVTRHGRPVARIVPEFEALRSPDVPTVDLAERMRAFRASFGDRLFPWSELKQMRDDGRL